MNTRQRAQPFRSFFETIGGKYALADETIVLTILVSVAANLAQLGTAIVNDGQHLTFTWVLCRLVVTTLYFTILRAFRPLLLPVTARRARPLVALIAYLGLPLTLALIDRRFFAELVAEQESLTVFQLSLRTLVFLPILAFLVTRYMETSELAQMAITENTRLLKMRESIHSETEGIVAQTKQSISERIEPALSEIMRLLRTSGVKNTVLSAQVGTLLENTLNSIVRPVSRELLEPEREIESLVRHNGLRRFSRLNYPINLNDVIVPARSALLVLVELYFLTFANLAQVFSIEFILLFVSLYAGALTLIRGRVRLCCGFAENHWTWLLIYASYAGLYFVSALITGSIYISGTTTTLTGPIAAAIPLAMWNTVLSFLIYLNLASKNQIRTLDKTNEELGDLVAAQRRELWAQKSRLSWILHGPIQSAIVSASVEINQGEISEERREAVLRRLQDAISTLNRGAHNTVDLEVAISELTTVWSRVCQITTTIDPALDESLEPNTSEFESVVELVREALSNAVRHGGARKVDISINAPRMNLIVLRVVNDAQLPSQPRKAGLGTRLYNQVATTWSLTSEASQTVFQAELKVVK